MDVIKPATWTVAGAFLLTFFAVAIFRGHGFNFTDEGWYLLSSAHPEEYVTWPSCSFHITGFLFKLLHYDIASFRMAGLLLLTAAAAFLGYAVYALLLSAGLATRHAGTAVLCTATTGLGALVYYTWGLYTPSYNLMNAVVVAALAAFCVLIYARHLEGASAQGLTWFTAGAGACLTSAFFIKFPVGIVLTGVCMLWFCWLRLPGQAVTLTASMTGAVGLYFVFIQPLPEWQATFINGITAATLMKHDPNMLLWFYTHDLYKNLLASPGTLALGASTAAAYAFAQRSGSAFPLVWRWAPPVLLLCLVLQLFDHRYADGGRYQILHLQGFYSLWVLLFAVFLTCAGAFNRRRLMPICVLLFLLPWAASLGTNNPLTAQALFSMAPVFALFLMLFFAGRAAAPSSPFPVMGLSIVTLFAAGQIISAPFIAPYEINGTLPQQTVDTRIGVPSSTLKVDAQTHDFLINLQAIAHIAGFKPGDDILAFDDVPGLVFALGGVSPSTTWWFGKWVRTRTALNEFCLKFIPTERLRRAFILQTVPDQDIAPFLTSAGRFPEDYVLAGEAVRPMSEQRVRFWIPPGRTAPH